MTPTANRIESNQEFVVLSERKPGRELVNNLDFKDHSTSNQEVKMLRLPWRIYVLRPFFLHFRTD